MDHISILVQLSCKLIGSSWSVSFFTATHCNTLQLIKSKGIAHHLDTINLDFVLYTLQHTATHCNLWFSHRSHINLDTIVVQIDRFLLKRLVFHCNTLQHTATHCNLWYSHGSHVNLGTIELQCVAVCGYSHGLHINLGTIVAQIDRFFLKRRVFHCYVLQHSATHCNIAHWGLLLSKWALSMGTHCNTLQRTATHCNMAHWWLLLLKQVLSMRTHTATHTATRCNTLQHSALMIPAVESSIAKGVTCEWDMWLIMQCVVVCCTVLHVTHLNTHI